MKRPTDLSSPNAAAHKPSQVDRFRDAARELGADASEAAFDQALRMVASAPPAPMHKPVRKKRRSASATRK